MKNYVIQKLIYATVEIKAETEEEALSEAKCLDNNDWNICEYDASEDYSIVEEELVEGE